MGSSKVFQWARAVLSPQFLSHIPSDVDCDVLLSEVSDGLQLGLTTDLTTRISCLALQGKWEDILRAEIKLTEFLKKWQEEKSNEDVSLRVETHDESSRDDIKLISSRNLVKSEENVAELPKDSVEKVDQPSETTFSKKLPTDSSDKTNSSQEDLIVDVISKGQLNCDVHEVLVVSDDSTPLDLLPSSTRSITSDPQDASNSSDEAEKISAALDNGSQLIIVTNSDEDSKLENIIGQNDEKGDELYMNLSSEDDYDESLADMDLKETMKIKNGGRKNPSDKFCQSLEISEEESTSKVTVKNHNEFKWRRRYKEKLPFKCHSCSFKTIREDQYLRHLRLHGKHKFIYHCVQCPFKTFRTTILRRHERQHGESHMIKCAQCPYETEGLELLKKHIQTKHSTTKSLYKCGQCDFKVDSLHLLKIHRFERHAVKQKNMVSCNLTEHSAPQSFLCELCGSTFQSLSIQKKHLKMVHCDTEFVARPQHKRIIFNKVTLTRHQKTDSSKNNGADNAASNTSKSLTSGDSCPSNEENRTDTSNRVQVFEGRKPGSRVFHDGTGYYYHVKKEGKKNINLKCSEKSCSVRAMTPQDSDKRDSIKITTGKHNHEPDLLRVGVCHLRSVLMERSASEPTSIRKIYDEEASKTPKNVGAVVSFQSVRQSMYRARASRQPLSIEELRDYLQQE